ncbi:hypothetical protein ACFSRY_11570 [Pontibacter locisalis]|uniref:Uncharacterized protein n=1 Tax=Pontibacter locisalis TaxID=1719035 RepID=A0ABW5IMG4_9BACT
MGKRQVRIFRKDLDKHLSELLRQPTVQVVLRSKVVMHGILRTLGEGKLQLEDFRFGKHNFTADQVEEIIYDLESPY